MKNLLTLRNDSSIVVKYLANFNFAVYDKDYQMFELQASMPGMRSAEHQTTIPLKFLIIISTYM